MMQRELAGSTASESHRRLRKKKAWVILLALGLTVAACADDEGSHGPAFHNKHHSGTRAPSWYKVPQAH
ncbi:hypothetical protein [Acetobacter conturbans]|uniref:Lipoprotein n=1 Tax=Acetobacter conturbans TaxID=1737472 RepID=A0ABX0K198_9PROT|nr:hypothetical protein [Acetobacter conturbans]NHN87504.1 hypothetical protein [Acetobacter conturbans]